MFIRIATEMIAVTRASRISLVSRYLALLRPGNFTGNILLMSGVSGCLKYPISSRGLHHISLLDIQDCFVESGVFPILCTMLQHSWDKFGSVIIGSLRCLFSANKPATTIFKNSGGLCVIRLIIAAYEFLKNALVADSNLLNSIIDILIDCPHESEIGNEDVLNLMFDSFKSLLKQEARLALTGSLLDLTFKNQVNRFIMSRAGSVKDVIEKMLPYCKEDTEVYLKCLELLYSVASVSASPAEVAALLSLLRPDSGAGRYYDDILAIIVKVNNHF